MEFSHPSASDIPWYRGSALHPHHLTLVCTTPLPCRSLISLKTSHISLFHIDTGMCNSALPLLYCYINYSPNVSLILPFNLRLLWDIWSSFWWPLHLYPGRNWALIITRWKVNIDRWIVTVLSFQRCWKHQQEVYKYPHLVKLSSAALIKISPWDIVDYIKLEYKYCRCCYLQRSSVCKIAKLNLNSDYKKF